MRMLFIPEQNGPGLRVAFENIRGRYWSFFNAPPQSINHVHREYLHGRFRNVRDKRHVDFIKREWAKYMESRVATIDGSILKIGDKVVMHTCGEAAFYKDVVWTVRSNPWTLCGSEVILLEGFSGGFSTEYLQKVDMEKGEIDVEYQ